jgi:DNA-binding response OmpR family regulator/anti-sigma regulatory factor (Ser/Thr protein kinase)
VEIEKIESQKQQELIEAKVKFFMNVSHEFKTPITLILGPLQWLAKHYSKDNLARSYLSIIKNQADYLMNLLEQLVYFRKAESAILELKCQLMDLVEFLQQIMGSYEWQANEQNINLSLNYSEPQIFIWFDPKKLEKVFHNLISNAFKYTKPGGRITLNLHHNHEEHAVLVSVKDTGKGIASEELEHIFERFYQVDSSAGGYGIGLSLTKSLIELHKGSISVSSVKGKGSVFTIMLQTGSGHLSDEQKIGNIQIPVNEFSPKEHKEAKQVINEMQKIPAEINKTELILIVEDNLRMLAFLEKVFCSQYKILTAKNGQEAMDLIAINMPDLIISDLMMPEMDGLTFCKKIKQEILTCHIPFILLTAKGEVESRIEGLETGADQYIPKPFDINLLTANVRSLISNRNKIKERITMNLPFDLTSEKIHPLDKELLEKINEVVEVNYENPDFDSNEFSRKVYMNRSLFFKKMKAVTGQTPSEYIRAYRMKRAVEFMIKDRVPVSEVNYKVGISSRSYFTKCFKELYGSSPSDFIKKRGQAIS